MPCRLSYWHSKFFLCLIKTVVSCRVPTLEGEAEVKVRPGTQPGQRLRMRGYGIPHVHNPSRKGDQFVEINIRITGEVNAEQRRLLEAFREEEQQKKKKAA